MMAAGGEKSQRFFKDVAPRGYPSSSRWPYIQAHTGVAEWSQWGGGEPKTQTKTMKLGGDNGEVGRRGIGSGESEGRVNLMKTHCY